MMKQGFFTKLSGPFMRGTALTMLLGSGLMAAKPASAATTLQVICNN